MCGTSMAVGIRVIHERGVEQLPVLVDITFLVEGIADALGHAALNLPVQSAGLITRPQSCTTT